MKKQTIMKIVAVALTVAMMATMVACGGSGNTDSSTPSSSTPASNSESQPSESTPASTEETPVEDTYDFGGQVVKVYGGIWNKLDPASQDNDVPLALAAEKAVEEKYNIDIQWTEPAGLTGGNTGDALVNSFNSGASSVNLYASDPDSLMTLISNNVLADVTNDIGALEIGSLYTNAVTWKGKVFGYTYDDIGGSANVIAYSRTLLDQIGMEKTPTDMFMEGKWSYQDVLDYCAELKSKLPEGTYPFGIHYYHWALMAGAANGGYPSVTGEGHLNLAEENYTQALEFYKELIDKGYAYPVDFGYEGDELVSDGEQTFYGDGNMGIDTTNPKNFVMTRVEDWQQDGVNTNTNGNWGICFWPWGDSVTCDGDYTTLSDNYRVNCYYWTSMVVMGDASTQTGISNEDLLKISLDYVTGTASNRAGMHTAWEAEQAGETPDIGFDKSNPRNFSTSQDLELWQWAYGRTIYDWAWVFDKAGITDVWTNAAEVVSGHMSGRAAGESAIQTAEALMEQRGLK